MARSGRLYDKVLELFGSLKCRDIRFIIRGIPADLDFRRLTEAQKREANRTHDKSAEITGLIARLTAEIIFEPIESFKHNIFDLLMGIDRSK